MSQIWSTITINNKDIEQNKKCLNEIIKGRSSALIIKNFYDLNSCKTIIQRVNTKKFNKKDHVAKKIGVSLASYVNRKSDYFIQADNIRKTLREIFSGLEDPRKKVHNLLGEFFPNKEITIAKENEKKYACGVIRLHGLGDFAPIHRDNVVFEAKNFDVAKFSTQLSTILYIQQSEEGGELVLYKKPWKKSDEKFRNIEFGYSDKVITDSTQHVIIKPNPGDLVIINPLYYHEILPVRDNKKRITLGLFLAFSNYGKKVVTWS